MSEVTVREAHIGPHSRIDETATVGYQHDDDGSRTVVGENAVIRAGSTIYADVVIGDDLTTGHDVLVREQSVLGDDVLVGTNAVLDGFVKVGSHVSLQTGVYLPPGTTIGDHVFVGPHAVCTNDRYPVRSGGEHRSASGPNAICGPTLEDHVSVGANATILPGVTIGERSFVAAGAVVTADVPPDTLAVGVPAVHRRLPDALVGGNEIA